MAKKRRIGAGRRRSSGAGRHGRLGYVTEAQLEDHLASEIMTHQWIFAGSYGGYGPRTEFGYKTIVMQRCEICGKKRELDGDTGRVLYRR